MLLYDVFKRDDQNNLVFLGEVAPSTLMDPGVVLSFPDTDDTEKDWIIREVYFSDSKDCLKHARTVHRLGPIVVLYPL